MLLCIKASSQYDTGSTYVAYLVNDITSYRSDLIGVSGASTGMDSSSTPAEPT